MVARAHNQQYIHLQINQIKYQKWLAHSPGTHGVSYHLDLNRRNLSRRHDEIASNNNYYDVTVEPLCAHSPVSLAPDIF